MKRLGHIFIAVFFAVSIFLPQTGCAAGWSQYENIVINEPNQASVFLAARDPDELPVIPAPGQQKKLKGDADGNGAINYMDALLVLRHSVGLEELSATTVKLCDVDNSGDLNYMDALLILRYSVGLITGF